MTGNDVLRRVRFALDLSDSELVRLCGLGGETLAASDLCACLAHEDDPDFAVCPDWILGAFLDGLVLDRRGPREPGTARREPRLDNNGVLKKLRIALSLDEASMLALIRRGGIALSPSELGAFFRTEGHKNYRPCGDQVLRAFLRGLIAERRGVGAKDGQARGAR